MKVYGVWFVSDDGTSDLEGLFSTAAKARKAVKRLLEDGCFNEDPFYITKMNVDDKEEWTFDVKGEMVI
jgi:hypothetical protein